MTGEKFAQHFGVELTAHSAGVGMDGAGWEHHRYDVELVANGRQFTTVYRMGMGLDGPPNVGEVLEALALDAASGELPFSEWCNEYGYAEDSRKAHATWLACRKARSDARRWCGDTEGMWEVFQEVGES